MLQPDVVAHTHRSAVDGTVTGNAPELKPDTVNTADDSTHPLPANEADRTSNGGIVSTAPARLAAGNLPQGKGMAIVFLGS